MVDLDPRNSSKAALWRLGAADAAALIASGELSPVLLIEASLARIAQVQPRLNPFASIFEAEARTAARAAEAAVRDGAALGPLHGVPVAIKDFTPSKGHRTTRGSLALRDWVPDADPVIVRRLKAAGAIIVGKTTTPEFAFSGFTRSPLFGDTLNPWNPARSAGGSSGGSAVAVATGCVMLAEGTDMGGSVRIPAALCGIVGLKPSLGRIPMDILSTAFDQISHFGPLARSVEDAALLLRVLEGPDEADPQSQIAPLPLPALLDPNLAGLRIALSPDLGFYAVDADVLQNLGRAADALREAGATVEPVDLGWTAEIAQAAIGLWQVFLAAEIADLLPEHRGVLDPDLLALVDTGFAMSAVEYRRLDRVRTQAWRQLAAVLTRFDALVCPTMTMTAPLQTARDADFERVDAGGRLHGLDMTAPFNTIGPCPVLSVPSGFGIDGLPTAVQIVGRRFDDPTALRIGRALELQLAPSGFPRPPLPV